MLSTEKENELRDKFTTMLQEEFGLDGFLRFQRDPGKDAVVVMTVDINFREKYGFSADGVSAEVLAKLGDSAYHASFPDRINPYDQISYNGRYHFTPYESEVAGFIKKIRDSIRETLMGYANTTYKTQSDPVTITFTALREAASFDTLGKAQKSPGGIQAVVFQAEPGHFPDDIVKYLTASNRGINPELSTSENGKQILVVGTTPASLEGLRTSESDKNTQARTIVNQMLKIGMITNQEADIAGVKATQVGR